MGGMRNMYNILIEKPEGKRSLGRPRGRWEDNIREVGLMYLTQDRGSMAGPCEHCNEPLGPIKVGEFLDWLSDY
jgi:hypothetical protein